MGKRIGRSIVSCLLFVAASAYAQETDFHELARTGTRMQIMEAVGGIDVNREDRYDRTPLMYAAGENPNSGVVAALIEAGADVGATDRWGKSVVVRARENQSLRGTEVLRRLEELSR